MARGSVKPRPLNDGTMRYRVKWESVGPDGKRRHHSATTATKKAAEILLAEKLREVNEGTFLVPSRETVEAFLRRWLQASSFHLAESTAYQYELLIRNRIAPYVGAIPLAKLDEITIQDLYARLMAAGYAPSSVNQTHKMLHCALRQAVTWRLLTRNPADGVTSPKPVIATPTVWSPQEAAAFLDHTHDDPLAALWRLGLDSGMRIGELLALSWRDLDAERRVIAVRRTLTKTRGGSWKLGEIAKTASSRRSIALGAATVGALRALRPGQAERRLLCGGAWQDHGLIFDRGDGRWLEPRVVGLRFARAVEAAQLPPMTLHGMRHTMATLLLAAGVHPKIVQERLGHASIRMTLDRYSHVTPVMQQEAAAILDGLLTGGRGQSAASSGAAQ